MTITINGYSGQYLGWVDQNRVGSNTVGTNPNNSTCVNCASLGHFDMLADQRLNLQGRANLGDGLSVGVQLEINGSQSGSSNYAHNRAGNVYLDFAGFGRVTIGTQTAIGRSMVGSSYSTGNPFPTGAPLDVFGRTGMVSGGSMHSLLINPTGSSGTNSTINGENGDMNDSYSNKIVYLTPRIFGFQLGASWLPELSKDVTGTGEVVSKDGQKATYRNGVSVGVNYIQNFAGVDVAAGFAYQRYLDQPNKSALGIPGSVPGTGGLSVPDPEQFQAGLALGYAGFKIGGGWGKISNGRQQSTSLSEYTGQQVFTVSTANSSLVRLQGEAWSIGGSYAFGPASVSVNYTDANNNDCPVFNPGPACSGKDKFTGIGASGSYTIGPGVSLTVGGFYGRYRGNNYNGGKFVDPTQLVSASTASASATNASQRNAGGGVIGGLLVRF